MIAVAAKEEGLLKDEVTRNEAISSIRGFMERTNQTFERNLPLNCLEKSKENLL